MPRSAMETRKKSLEYFVVRGGSPIDGTIVPMGSKNEALPCIAACLLTEEPVTLKNVPEIEDVLVMFDLVRSLGGSVERTAPNTFRVECREVNRAELDKNLCARVRASILFVGPMLARLGRVTLSPPGGDVIGRRRLDTHFMGMKALGAKANIGKEFYLESKKLHGADLFLDEASVTGTENILMAASMAAGFTCIRNAACEPHVQGLARMLNAMGAKVSGAGSNYLSVEGVDKLHGAEHTIGPDYLEIGSFIGAAAVTGGELRIQGVRPEDLRSILNMYSKLGLETEFEGEDTLLVPGRQEMRVQFDLMSAIPKIDDAPWPQFPTDLMSVAIVVATQAHGTLLFFEKMFEGRMFFVDHLIGMGAKIILCDPHRVVVVGPSRLYGGRMESPDIRAGMALLTAALCAQGETHIYNIRQIDRGYQQIDERLRRVGANIERVVIG